jgi:hypothetical protein
MQRVQARRLLVAVKTVPIVFLAVALVVIQQTTTSTTASQQQEAEEGQVIRVDGSRPLAKAVLAIERLCHCPITYEDYRYTQSDVVDATQDVRRDGKTEPKVFGPRGGPYSFLYNPIASKGMSNYLNQVIANYNQFTYPGRFRVVSTPNWHHVVPDGNASILTTPIFFPSTNGTIKEVLQVVLAQISAETGVSIGWGTVPLKAMDQRQTREGGTKEPAYEILARLLSRLDSTWSWQLLYDFSFRAYYFNAHSVS